MSDLVSCAICHEASSEPIGLGTPLCSPCHRARVAFWAAAYLTWPGHTLQSDALEGTNAILAAYDARWGIGKVQDETRQVTVVRSVRPEFHVDADED